jgi:hypothetical protein
VHDPTNKEDHVCARRRDGEAAGPFWEVGSSGGAPALVIPPGRMLKKTASIVLASLRGSTY